MFRSEPILCVVMQTVDLMQGCGIVTFNTHEEALHVLDNLVHTFTGMNDPMVLKWMDQNMQKRRRTDEGPMPGPGGRFGELYSF